MKAYNVRLETSEIHLSDEELAILTEYNVRKISVTELCNKFSQYGLQVVRISDKHIRLQMDVINGKTEAIISFEIELE